MSESSAVMNTVPTIAPRKYGNEYFDVMEAPISCWPEKTVVVLESGSIIESRVEIPTVEIWVAGDFVSRQYATTPFSAIKAWLKKAGIIWTRCMVENTPNIVPCPSYKQAA